MMKRAIWKVMLVLGMLFAGAAWAQAEPSLNDIYAAAQAGRLEQAQVMVQQVLVSHPKSAKAHFVRSELYARQGEPGLARESLARAEQLAPGLPFAKPAAVQALRGQLATTQANVVPVQHRMPAASSGSTSSSGGGWVVPVLLTVGVMVVGFLVLRRRPPEVQVLQPAYGTHMGSGLNGPESFNQSPGSAYAQPAGSGLGGKIMGGVATGLAVGAGVMAAEAIGRNLMGGHDRVDSPVAFVSPASEVDHSSVDINRDMGGTDFGINDASAWDDPGVSGDSSSDWDS